MDTILFTHKLVTNLHKSLPQNYFKLRLKGEVINKKQTKNQKTNLSLTIRKY